MTYKLKSGHALVLRTSDTNRRSYGSFQWPETGPVECTDFEANGRCGNGLHGLLWGVGDGSLLNLDETASWQVVDVLAAEINEVTESGGGKVKFPRGEVVFTGSRDQAIELIDKLGGRKHPLVFAARTAGDRGTATAGYRGTATAGYGGTATAGDGGTATAGYGGTATAGDGGTATAGDRGTATAGDGGTATAGDRGTATAGDEGTATAGDGGTATAGDRGTATAGDEGTATAGDRGTATAGDRGTATAGYRGTATAGDGGTATAGDRGTATAGDEGTLAIQWFDAKAQRYRVAIAYTGEDGIESGELYRLDGDKFVKIARKGEAA